MSRIWGYFLVELVLFGLKTHGTVIYFLVAEAPGREWHNESYVLPLTRDEDIAHARRLAAGDYSDRTIPVARITCSPDGINRDHLKPDKPLWSWHVVEFRGFGDGVIPTISGWPSRVEQNCEEFTRNSQGLIGFFTIVAELGPGLCITNRIAGDQAELSWTDMGTNYQYTVQSNNSLNATNWTPAAGATWPIQTNRWMTTIPRSGITYYRVKADKILP